MKEGRRKEKRDIDGHNFISRRKKKGKRLWRKLSVAALFEAGFN
jgi:hypothetical protein